MTKLSKREWEKLYECYEWALECIQDKFCNALQHPKDLSCLDIKLLYEGLSNLVTIKVYNMLVTEYGHHTLEQLKFKIFKIQSENHK